VEVVDLAHSACPDHPAFDRVPVDAFGCGFEEDAAAGFEQA
jgi:hypothetical protein